MNKKSKKYEKRFVAKDGTKVLFREPRATDAKLAMEYINSFVKEKRNGMNITKKKTLKQETEWLKRVLSQIKKNDVVCLFVLKDSKIVGNCAITRKERKQNHRAYLGISLHKSIREKGIGTSLIKEVINLAKKRMKGIKIIETSVLDYNKRAQHVYKKNGFKKVATIPKSVKEDGKYFSEHWMYLELK